MGKFRRLKILMPTIVIITIIIASFAIRPFTDKGWLPLILIPSLLLGFHYRQMLISYVHAVFVGFSASVVVVFGLAGLQIMRSNIANPNQWDFHTYWVYGLAAAQKLNPYEPANLERLAQVLNPSEELLAELFYFYAPPTFLLFIPLGWFNIHTAYFVWYVLHGTLLLLDIYLLWKIFLADSGWVGLIVVAALILMLRATLTTIWTGQLNFLVLLMFLLFWQNRNRLRGGMWLALGILAKPVLFFIPLYLLLKRSWHVIANIIITLAVLSLITILVFGPAMFFSYFTANPIVYDMPDYLYTENVNQSLLATILRLTQYDISVASPFFHPIFIITSLIITGVTSWLVLKLRKPWEDWALALTLLLALLIFPETLTHYSVLIIVPALLLWTQRQQMPGGVWSVIPFIALTYTLIAVRNGNYVFVALALNWLMFAAVGVWITLDKPVPSWFAKLFVPLPGNQPQEALGADK